MSIREDQTNKPWQSTLKGSMQLEKHKKNPSITVKHIPDHMVVWEKREEILAQNA